MEIEKCLYKIHERTLGVSCCQRFMKACFFSLFMLSTSTYPNF